MLTSLSEVTKQIQLFEEIDKNIFDNVEQRLTQLFINDILSYYDLSKILPIKMPDGTNPESMIEYITSMLQKQCLCNELVDYYNLICERVYDNANFVNEYVNIKANEDAEKDRINVIHPSLLGHMGGMILSKKDELNKTRIKSVKKISLNHKPNKRTVKNIVKNNIVKNNIVKNNDIVNNQKGGAIDYDNFIRFIKSGNSIKNKNIVNKNIFIATSYNYEAVSANFLRKDGFASKIFYNVWDLFGNKKKPEDIIDYLKKNNQYLPLIFKEIKAIGFLNENNDNTKTIDDRDIKIPNIYWSNLNSDYSLFGWIFNMFPFLTGNSPSTIMNLSWIVSLLSVSITNIKESLTTYVRDNLTTLSNNFSIPFNGDLTKITMDEARKLLSQISAANEVCELPYGAVDGVCKAPSSLAQAIRLTDEMEGVSEALSEILSGYVNYAIDKTGSAIEQTSKFVDFKKVAELSKIIGKIINDSSNFVFENVSTIASIGLVVIIICSIYNLSTSQSVNKDTILNDFSLVTLFTMITQIQTIEIDTLNIPPINILVQYIFNTYQKMSFYQKAMNTTTTNSFKVPSLKTIRTEITRNSIKPIDIPGIKNKLTNLNIP